MSKEKILHFTIFGLHFTINVNLWLKYTAMVWVLLLLIFLVSITIFEYRLTTADVPCSIVFGGLVGYLIYVILE